MRQRKQGPVPERILENTSQLLSAAVKQSGEGIVVADLQGNLVFVNDAFAAMHGYSPQELQGKHLSIFHTPEQMPSVEAANQQIKETGQFSGEIWHVRRDGTVFPTLMQNTLLRDEVDQPVGLISTLRDITGAKQIEKVLQESEQWFRKIVEISPLPISIIDPDGQYEYVNPRFTEVLGYTLEDISTEEEWFAQAYPNATYRQHVIEAWQSDLAQSKAFDDQQRVFHVTCKDGTVREILFRPTTMEDGRQLVMHEDITDRMWAETLMLTQRDLAIALSMTRSLPEALDELLEIALRINGIDSGGIYLSDFSTGSLDLVAHRGLSSKFVDNVSHHETDSPQVQLVVTGEPVYQNYSELPEAIRADIKGEGLRSLAVIPVKNEGEIVAVLNLASRTLNVIPTAVRNILETIAVQIGPAVTRIAAEEALRDSRERFRTIANFTHDWEYWLSPQGAYLYISPSCERITGYRMEAFFQDPELLLEITHPDDRVLVIQHLEEALIYSGAQSLDFRIITRSGEERWLAHVCQPVHGEDGRFLGRRASNRDITERKRAEGALQIEKAHLEQLFENAPEAIVLVDNDSRVLQVNNEFTRMFGYTRNQTMGQSIDELLAPPELLEEAKTVTNQVAKGHKVSLETRRKHKDGRLIHVSIHGIPIKINSGQLAVYGIYRDITERKRAEEIQKQLYALEQQRSAELSDALEQQQELDRIKDEFVQNVSHELRQPLSLIRGHAELLADGELGELQAEQQNSAEVISRRAQMLSDLVHDITFILEVEAHPRELEPVSLSELAQAAVEDFELVAQQAALTLQVDIPSDLDLVNGSPIYVRRILDNLLGNALKFTPAGGRVTVRLYQDETRIVLQVEDTGIGIPSDQLERIFDRFYQVDGSSQRRYGGLGLGLALVQEITKLLGGQVTVESQVDQGSTFTIMLPTLTQDERSRSPEPLVPPAQKAPPPTDP